MDELPGALVLGPAQELCRGSVLDDLALVDERDVVGDLAGELQLVRHHDHRPSFLCEIAHEAQDLPDQFRVEGRGRLVEEQQLGSQREGADDPDTLLLPAGQRRRVAGLLGPEADPGERR